MNLKIYCSCSTQATVSLTIKFLENDGNEIEILSGNFSNVNDNAIPIKDIIDYLKKQNIEINLKHWFFFPNFEKNGVQSVSSNNECTIYLKEGIVNNDFQTSLAPEYEEKERGNINLKKEYRYVQVGDVQKIELKPHLKIVNGNFEVKKGYKEIKLPNGASSFSLKEGYIDTGADTEVIEGYAIDENGEPYIDDQGNFVIKDYYIKDANGKIKLKEGYTKDGSIDKRYQEVNGVFQLKKGYVQAGLLKGTLIEGYKADNNGDTHLKSGYKLDAKGDPCLKFGYKLDANGEPCLKLGYKLDANGEPCLKFGYALDKQGEPYLKKEALAIGGVSGLGILGLIVYMFLIRKK